MQPHEERVVKERDEFRREDRKTVRFHRQLEDLQVASRARTVEAFGSTSLHAGLQSYPA